MAILQGITYFSQNVEIRVSYQTGHLNNLVLLNVQSCHLQKKKKIYIYIYTHTHTYSKIYIYTHKTIFTAYCTQVYLIGHPSSIFNLNSTAKIEETILLLRQVLKALNTGYLFNNHLPRAGYMSGVQSYSGVDAKLAKLSADSIQFWKS